MGETIQQVICDAENGPGLHQNISETSDVGRLFHLHLLVVFANKSHFTSLTSDLGVYSGRDDT